MEGRQPGITNRPESSEGKLSEETKSICLVRILVLKGSHTPLIN